MGKDESAGPDTMDDERLFDGSDPVGSNMELRIVKSLAFAAALAVLVPYTQAHHSFPVHYDSNVTRTIQGVAKSFRFTNPHGILQLEVTNADGEIETWTIETTAPVFMRRRGWSQDMIQPGDEVLVEGWPARDGSHLMRIRTLARPDGTPLAQPLEAGSD